MAQTVRLNRDAATAGGVAGAPLGAVLAFERVGALGALAAGVAGVLYAFAFVVLRDPLLSAVFLLAGGLASSAALVAVYERLKAGAGLAVWALLLGTAGALGSALHAGYDLAVVLHPPAVAPGPDLPSMVDPRGLLTFGVAGLALLVVAALVERYRALPAGLGRLGALLGVLLIALYLARLILLEATNPVLLALAVVVGFVVSPTWYLWLGVVLWRRPAGGV